MASIYDPGAGLDGLCDTILHESTELLTNNNPWDMRSRNGTLDAITSSMNTAAVQKIELQKPSGKYLGRYRIMYDNRTLASEVGEDLTCDTPDDRVRDFEEEIDVTQTLASKGFTLQYDAWQQICADPQTMFQKYLADDMAAAREALNQRLADRVVANCVGVNLGHIVSGSPSASAKTVNILNSDRTNRAQGMADFFYDWTTNLLTGPPIVVSRGNMEYYRLQQQWGCCNDKGINEEMVAQYMNQAGMAFYLDHYAETAFGENNALIWAPGALQLVTVNRFKGIYGANIAGTRTFTIADSNTPGLFWDVLAKEIPCADGTGMPAYSIQLQLNWDTSCIPAEAYKVGDPLRGMTNVLLYNFGEAA